MLAELQFREENASAAEKLHLQRFNFRYGIVSSDLFVYLPAARVTLESAALDAHYSPHGPASAVALTSAVIDPAM